MKKLTGIFFISIFLFSCTCKHNVKETNTENISNDSLPKDISFLNEKISKDPGNADLYNQRAKLYLEKQMTDNALKDISKALEISSSDPDYLCTLSDVYLAMGKVQNCEDALKKAVMFKPENTAPLIKLARLYLYLKKYDKSKECLEKAVQVDNFNPQAYLIMGMIWKEKGDTAKAVKNFQKAVEQDQKLFDAYCQLGLVFAGKNPDFSINYYRNAINVNPQSVEARYSLGMVYQQTNQFEKAIEMYKSIIQINPSYKFSYFNLGYIYLVHLEKYDSSAYYFTNAVKADTAYFEAYYNRGCSYELLKNYSRAEADYKRALQIKPNYEKAVQGLNRIDNITSKHK